MHLSPFQSHRTWDSQKQASWIGTEKKILDKNTSLSLFSYFFDRKNKIEEIFLSRRKYFFLPQLDFVGTGHS